MSIFAIYTASAWLLVVLGALFRSKTYALSRGIGLGLFSLIAVGIWPMVSRDWLQHPATTIVPPLFVYLQLCVYLQSLMLVRPRMRSTAYRVLVSLPDAFFQAGTLLAFPWAIAVAFGFEPFGWWIPYALAAIGMAQSLSSRRDVVELVVGDGDAGEKVKPHRVGDYRRARPLRIVQITDPHLGTFMPISRLRAISERAVEQQPDLVLLTGDFLTMESQSDPTVLSDALAPLKSLEGKAFACLGNHDLEAPDTVKSALADAGVRLLVDESIEVDTAAGQVQLLGVDFYWRGRDKRLPEICRAHPRAAGALRIMLLHDPAAFRHVPSGEADLVMSGHTHGGQLGLVSLGLSWTLIRAFSKSPDHGLWARGPDRLYVHRGTGHYGFPLRLGVPAEESLLQVHWPAS
jgi:predicted MPP superfamily phosphohydrolase